MPNPDVRDVRNVRPDTTRVLLLPLLLAATLLALPTWLAAQPGPGADNRAPDNRRGNNASNANNNNAGAAPETNAPPVRRTALDNRIDQVKALFRENPVPAGGYETLFTADFLAAVPPAELTKVFQQYFTNAGAIESVFVSRRVGEHVAELEFRTRTRKKFPMRLGVDPADPHRINYLWVGAIVDRFGSLEEILNGLKELPGKVSFAAWRLPALDADADAKPEPIAELRADSQLPTGSAFKLWILGALADEVNAGRRELSNTTTLRAEWRSYPSGILHTWPVGSPITLHSLATQMISISDNTATDHLLHVLGRQRVEAQMATMGHARPSINRPFLSTYEMFRIKETGFADTRVPAFVNQDEGGRREFLRMLMKDVKYDEWAGMATAKPTAIETVEWFASAGDLCRTMDYLRRVTVAGKPAAPLREVLAVNPGLKPATSGYRYAGFKGGSEPGVICLTLLLQRRDGAWLAVSCLWCNPEAPVDQGRLISLVSGVLTQLAE